MLDETLHDQPEDAPDEIGRALVDWFPTLP